MGLLCDLSSHFDERLNPVEMSMSVLFRIFALLWAAGATACANNCIKLDDHAGDLCGIQYTEMKTTSVHGLPSVSASLGDRTMTLLLDTGASATVISAALIGRPNQSYYRLRDALCFDEHFCLENTLVYAWDTALSDAATEEINGVVGMDVLKHFSFRIKRGASLSLEHKAEPCAGASVPITYNQNGTPTVDAHIDDLALSMLLDTGAAVCLLNDETAAALAPYFQENAVEAEGCTAEGCDDDVFSSSIAHLCIGDTCLDAVDTKYPAWNAVGSSFFSAYDVTFDFPNDTLRFCTEVNGYPD